EMRLQHRVLVDDGLIPDLDQIELDQPGRVEVGAAPDARPEQPEVPGQERRALQRLEGQRRHQKLVQRVDQPQAPDERAPEGAIDWTPTSDPWPSAVPGGRTAPLPTNTRRPRRVGARVIQPPSMRAAPSDTSSAIVLPSPISRRSGVAEVAVESSTSRPRRAP